MSTVDEVLATAEVVDAVCVIDGETRIISVPNEYKELGVESDEKVTRVKFQCPKIVGDNIDLTEYNLYINYRNAGNKLNSYLVEDVTVTNNIINFSWLLSRHVTERPGTISYIVCAKKSDYTGVINEWNTKVATGTVGVGLEATEEIEEQNIDIIEQILRSIVELENKVDGGGSSGSGLSSNAKTLLIAILRNAIYSSDQSVNITELESELESTSGGGSGGSGTVKYTVENNLTNVTSDNTKVLVDANVSYTATLSADEGFVLDAVTVTMGGEDVTATVYADGVIIIPAVTGDVVITATAVVISNDLLASATWTDSLRANSSGEWTNQTSWFGSSLISCEPSGTITITMNEGITGLKSVEWAFYDANQSKIKGVGGAQYLSNTSEKYPNTYSITAPEGASYIRFSLQKTSGSMDVYISAMKS